MSVLQETSMWEPSPDQRSLIELAAKCEGVSEAAFIEQAALAVAEHKLRKQVQPLLAFVAQVPKEMQGNLWLEIQTISLVLGFHYYHGLKTLADLDDPAEGVEESPLQ